MHKRGHTVGPAFGVFYYVCQYFLSSEGRKSGQAEHKGARKAVLQINISLTYNVKISYRVTIEAIDRLGKTFFLQYVEERSQLISSANMHPL